MLGKLDAFHKTRTGYLVFGLVELGLAYILGSLAINSGSLLQWFVAAILLFGAAQNGFRFLISLYIKQNPTMDFLTGALEFFVGGAGDGTPTAKRKAKRRKK